MAEVTTYCWSKAGGGGLLADTDMRAGRHLFHAHDARGGLICDPVVGGGFGVYLAAEDAPVDEDAIADLCPRCLWKVLPR